MRPPSWKIRAASSLDARALAVFHASCWSDAYSGIVEDAYLDRMHAAIDDRVRRWERRLQDPRRSVALAEMGGCGDNGDIGDRTTLGLVCWGESHDEASRGTPSLELASLYVAKSHWGSGIAAALLHHAIGDEAAQLWVFEANVRARKFYEKHGFSADGLRKIDEGTGVWECRYVRGWVSTSTQAEDQRRSDDGNDRQGEGQGTRGEGCRQGEDGQSDR